jgi:predicted metal-dependent enzyme (double-stranded beta helix superfamily)
MSVTTLSADPSDLTIPAGRAYPPLPELSRPTPAGLTRIIRVLALRSDLWRPLMQSDTERRGYVRLAGGDGWEAWLLTWMPGQSTGLHDHGPSAGAFTVLTGAVEELTPVPGPDGRIRLARRPLATGELRAFGPDHVHDVAGAGSGPAATLHAYGPALSEMNRFELDDDGRLRLLRTDRAGEDW